MDKIYVNTEPEKFNISTNPTGPTSSERRFLRAAVLSLSLLSVFLLARLISLGVYYHGLAAELSSVEANLSLSQLNSALIQVTKERNELQSLSERKKTCPSGWETFNGSDYCHFSCGLDWDGARRDCKRRGADLVVIDSPEEQTFLTGLTSDEFWIGLTDREKEGTWKWVDGTPLTLSYWGTNQPDNGGGDPGNGEQDCAYIVGGKNGTWADWPCDWYSRWICEKKAG